MEKVVENVLKVGLVVLVFTLAYLAARRNDRDRPWLWGLGAVLLCPGFLMLLLAYLFKGGAAMGLVKGEPWKKAIKRNSLIGLMAFLCPQCRQPFSEKELEQRLCAKCGRQV